MTHTITNFIAPEARPEHTACRNAVVSAKVYPWSEKVTSLSKLLSVAFATLYMCVHVHVHTTPAHVESRVGRGLRPNGVLVSEWLSSAGCCAQRCSVRMPRR